MYFRLLSGKRCYLSPIDPDDAEKFTRWLNDPEVTINLQRYNRAITLREEREALAQLAKGHNYSIVDAVSGALIGNCGFMDVDHRNQTAEAGIFIGDKAFWGKGYGSEALALLADFGFRRLNLRNIMLKVYSFNARAQACYKKVGFQEIGRRRQSLRRNLEVYDIIFMDLIPEDFYGRKA